MVYIFKKHVLSPIKKNYIYLLPLLWILIIFSLHSYVWFTNYGIYNIPILESLMGFSDASSWLAVASEISRGNLIPNAPSLGSEDQGIMHFPYFSLWIYGFFINVFGTTTSLLIFKIVLPIIIFFLMVRVYQIYLPYLWSLGLTSLGLISYSNIDFRKFLLDIISDDGWGNFLSGEQFAVASIPFPSLSLLFFLLAFILTFRNKKFLSNNRIFFLNILWSIQAYFHIINAFIGIPLWFLTLYIWLNRDKRNFNFTSIIRIISFQFLLTLVILTPFIFGIIEVISFQNFSSIGLISQKNLHQVTNYFFVTYFILPLILLGIAYYFFKVDKFEILVKFLPIFLLMIIELFLVLLKTTTGIGLEIELIFNRIGIFFLHLFYFVPALYYLSRDLYFETQDQNNLKNKIQKLINKFFNTGSKFYIPLLLVMLTLYSTISLNKYNERLKENMSEIQRQKLVIKSVSDITKVGSTIVSETLKTNFIFPSINSYGTLLVNRNVNKISLKENIERLVLWAKIRGLDKKYFLKFMSPNKNKLSSRLVKSFFISDENIKGVGYWLCLGTSYLNKNEFSEYMNLVIDTYDNFNFDVSTKKFNVNTIIVSKKFLEYENFEKVKTIDNISIFKIRVLR